MRYVYICWLLTRRSLVTILYDPYKLKGSFFLLYPTWNRSTHVYPTQNRLIGAILASLLSLFMGGASIFLYVSSPEGYFPPTFSRGTVFLPRRVLLTPPQKVVRVLLILLLILPQEVARVLLLFSPGGRPGTTLILPPDRRGTSLSVRLHALWCLSVNVLFFDLLPP